MTNTYHTIIIGLGGMGSAAAYHLAKRGKRVLGLEQFTPTHANGSSHGRSRIYRQAYFEGAEYVPLLLRAYENWRELERDSGEALLHLTGGLMLGEPDDITVAGALHSAQTHSLAYELLDAAEINRRYPVLRPSPTTVALYERNAGVVRPEATILAHQQVAAVHGAELHFGEAVLDWQANDGGVRVTTAQGVYQAERLILSPGAWAPQLMADLHLPLVVERQVLYWFAPKSGFAAYQPDRFPIYIWGLGNGLQLYGFPAEQDTPFGVKAAYFRKGEACTPETVDRTVQPAEIAHIRATLEQVIPDLNGELVEAKTCFYTTTPDEHFIIALHPHYRNVVLASPCSGHGYKFASVIGEILADLAAEGATKLPIALFDPARF